MITRQQRGERCPKNSAEKSFYIAAQAKGWTATKRGWPDFMCFGPNGEMVCVEVKPGSGAPLKRTQRLVMTKLAECGVKCYRWDPISGFTRI